MAIETDAEPSSVTIQPLSVTATRPVSWLRHQASERGNDRRLAVSGLTSCSLSCDGHRFLTCALSSEIHIWRSDCLWNTSSSTQESNPLLSTLSRHTGVVLCAQWHPTDPRVFASGADDQCVLVWQRQTTDEQYQVLKRLVGHASDVVALAWSCDGHLLASAGLDSVIRLYRTAARGFEYITKLEHKGFVKGLAFDPCNAYLASQGDDKRVLVHRLPTHNGSHSALVARVSLRQCSSDTFFQRLSWSPDGSHLAVTVALRSQQSSLVPAVPIVKRGAVEESNQTPTWSYSTQLVGHDAVVEVVRYSPVLFQKTSDSSDDAYFSILAAGDQTGTLSLFASHLTRPLFVLQNLFSHGISDLCWRHDGLSLLAISYDGTAVVLHITGLLPAPNHVLLAKQREQSKPAAMSREINEKFVMEAPLPESVEDWARIRQLQQQEKQQQQSATAVVSATMTSQPAALTSAPPPPLSISAPAHRVIEGLVSFSSADATSAQQTQSMQQVTVMRGGKKRIAPVLVSALPSVDEAESVSSSNNKRVHVSQEENSLKRPSMDDVNKKSNQTPLPSQMVQLMQTWRQCHQLLPPVLAPHPMPSVNDTSSNADWTLGQVHVRVIPSGKQSSSNSIVITRMNYWQERMAGNALLVSASDYFIALIVDDRVPASSPPQGRVVQVLSVKSGRRLMPPFHAQQDIVHAVARDWWLMLVTRQGQVQVLDLSVGGRLLHGPLSIRFLLENGESDASSEPSFPELICQLTSEGLPYFIVNQAHHWQWQPSLQVWMRLHASQQEWGAYSNKNENGSLVENLPKSTSSLAAIESQLAYAKATQQHNLYRDLCERYARQLIQRLGPDVEMECSNDESENENVPYQPSEIISPIQRQRLLLRAEEWLEETESFVADDIWFSSTVIPILEQRLLFQKWIKLWKLKKLSDPDASMQVWSSSVQMQT